MDWQEKQSAYINLTKMIDEKVAKRHGAKAVGHKFMLTGENVIREHVVLDNGQAIPYSLEEQRSLEEILNQFEEA